MAEQPEPDVPQQPMNIVNKERLFFHLRQHGYIDIRHCSSVRKIEPWSQRDDICLSDRAAAAAAAATRLCAAMTGRNLRREERHSVCLQHHEHPCELLSADNQPARQSLISRTACARFPEAAAPGGEPNGLRQPRSDPRPSLKATRQRISQASGWTASPFKH